MSSYRFMLPAHMQESHFGGVLWEADSWPNPLALASNPTVDPNVSIHLSKLAYALGFREPEHLSEDASTPAGQAEAAYQTGYSQGANQASKAGMIVGVGLGVLGYLGYCYWRDR